MKTEQEILHAQQRFDTLARSASRAKDQESYEVCANLASALGWVLGMPQFGAMIDKMLTDTRTVAREDN